MHQKQPPAKTAVFAAPEGTDSSAATGLLTSNPTMAKPPRSNVLFMLAVRQRDPPLRSLFSLLHPTFCRGTSDYLKTTRRSSMVKPAAILFGIVFLLVGILGFVPGVSQPGPDGMPMLLGIFMVNATHSIVHIASGAVFLICGMASAAASSTFFKIFGVVYALVAVMGFVVGNGMIFGLISNNTADTWLHVVLAASMLFLGFAAPASRTATA